MRITLKLSPEARDQVVKQLAIFSYAGIVKDVRAERWIRKL